MSAHISRAIGLGQRMALLADEIDGALDADRRHQLGEEHARLSEQRQDVIEAGIQEAGAKLVTWALGLHGQYRLTEPADQALAEAIRSGVLQSTLRNLSAYLPDESPHDPDPDPDQDPDDGAGPA